MRGSEIKMWSEDQWEDLEEKADWLTESINQLITRLSVEQTRLHQVC